MPLATRPSTALADSFHRPRPVPIDFDAFAATLRHDLEPRTLLETVLADRVILAAWRLQASSDDDADAARAEELLPPLSRDTLYAERSLETALDLLETIRSASPARWGRAFPRAASGVGRSTVAECDAPVETPDVSNEWPIIPEDVEDAEPDSEERVESEPSPRWSERLVFDFNISESSPVVKGTWVTVNHVVSLIVDGWSWPDVLRTHPELTEDDVRTCLAYTAARDDGDC